MKIGKARIAVCAVLFLCGTAAAGCMAAKTDGLEGKEGMTGRNVLAVLDKHKDELMAVPGVAGVAEGRCNGEPCIKVYVKEKTPEITAKVPSELGGFPVSVEVTGEFRPK
jgi:hypothetical protein